MADFARPAGTNSFGRTGGTAKDCLKFDDRASTPPEIGKYRKSVTSAPGVRFQHHGTAADFAGKDLEKLTFGECTEKGSCTAASLLKPHKMDDVERINLMKSEKTYQSHVREPLGRSLDRGSVLPSKFTDGQQAFGIASNRAQAAKGIIFPGLDEDSMRAEDIYRRSHGAIRPGEQINRGYDWHGDDMDKKVFGMKGNGLQFNGASHDVSEALRGGGNKTDQTSTIIRKEIEDMKNNGAILGKIKYLGQQDMNRSSELPFGIPSGPVRKNGKPRLSAEEVMKGDYMESDSRLDRDLGVSITPGFRNTNHLDERTYGCPTIRNDLAIRSTGRRSIADSHNYGDELSAHHLISPPPLYSNNSNIKINDTTNFSTSLQGPHLSSTGAGAEYKTKNQIQQLFTKIGYNLPSDVFNAIFEDASNGRKECSVNDFQNSLNSYLSAKDVNKENSWLSSRGM